MELSNDDLVNDFTYEFEVYIKSTGSDFELTSYQCAFNFNWWSLLLNGGEFTFSYIEGSSELTNSPSSGLGINNADDLLELTFASSPGNDNITSNRKRVGRFRLEKSTSFNGNVVNPNWNFQGKISTIITGSSFSNITNPASHINTILMDINNPEETIQDYQLHQNYPNPFNPSTKIKFGLKENSYVKLNIYNLLGENLMVVLNDNLQSGLHEVNIDASNLPSGVYIYKLEVENKFTAVKKMTLLK